MKGFFRLYQSLLDRGYPVRLLMSGLYENVCLFPGDDKIPFLNRGSVIYLKGLDLQEIARNYRRYLKANKQSAIELAKLTKGYACAYQVLGYLLYEKGNNEVDERLLKEDDRYLSDYVYEKVYFDLSDSEKKIISAFDTSEPIKLSSLCEKTGFSVKYLGVYRERLLRSGLLMSPSYGYLQLALPRFEVYLSYLDYGNI